MRIYSLGYLPNIYAYKEVNLQGKIQIKSGVSTMDFEDLVESWILDIE